MSTRSQNLLTLIIIQMPLLNIDCIHSREERRSAHLLDRQELDEIITDKVVFYWDV